MDRILFGDNQFFGVNHMSEEKARQQLMRFKDTAAIIEVLDDALDTGIRTFMCTTHERMNEVCDHMRADPARYKDYLLYPCMPYAHKYANAVSQFGALETIKRYSAGGVVGTLLRGAVGAITRDIYDLMKLLVDGEMKGFQGLNTPVIFVQNVVTDLLLGMKLHGVFAEFHSYVRKRYGAEAGFITMNLPALLDVLEGVGIENPIVCANINKIEFRMCGGRELYERTIRERRFRPVAMSVFASGAIPPEEALDYVCAQQRIESIVFGASSRRNIEQTRNLIVKLDAKHGRPAPA
ncbi:MAG TPA: hypothetical protein VGR31_12805 [Planctomycetota bacterium]|jgi:hypothetical protein|nr:hypothetical protein [Planctomycetota bacterium]